MIRLTVFLLAFLVVTSAAAQTAPPPPQQKIDQLIGLLQDPEIQSWLESRKKEQDATAAAAQPGSWGAVIQKYDTFRRDTRLADRRRPDSRPPVARPSWAPAGDEVRATGS